MTNQRIAVGAGAGSGIGRSAALALARRDFAVVLAGRNLQALQETADLAVGARQANGSLLAEPTMPLDQVGDAIAYMADLPLEANVQFMTIMATAMPTSVAVELRRTTWPPTWYAR